MCVCVWGGGGQCILLGGTCGSSQVTARRAWRRKVCRNEVDKDDASDPALDPSFMHMPLLPIQTFTHQAPRPFTHLLVYNVRSSRRSGLHQPPQRPVQAWVSGFMMQGLGFRYGCRV